MLSVNLHNHRLNTLLEAQRQLFVHAANGDLAKINEDFEQLADINQVDKEGNSALQIALINHQPVAVIQRLIDAGPELNYQNPRGKRAIDLVENSNIEQRSLLNTGECLRGIDWSLARDKVITAYAEHKSRVTRFLESKRDVQERCCAMMKYYQWVSRNDAYALYVWPGILLLNELASVFAFCPEEHLADPDVQALIEANEAQFKHTVVLYRTLFQWGLEAYPVLQAAASVNDEDWLFVKNGFLLKRRGFEAASSLSVRDIQEACVLDQVYKEAEAVALLETGIEHFYLNFLNRMAQTPHVEEIRKLATRIGKEQRTVESRLLNRVKMNNTVDSVCEEPEDIIEQGQSSRFIVLPEPAALPIAMKCANQQLSQVTLHFQQQGEALAEERRQLVQALAEEEIRVNQYINQLQQFIVASIQADVKLDLGISQAQAVIQREFDQVRAGLRQNYCDSRAKLEQKTFVGLVGMAVASFTGGALAPLIASSLVGATSGALAITTVMVEGAITAGINGAIAGKNPLTAAIQGAAFAGLSCHLAEGPLSNMSALRQGAIISMTISGLSTLVNGGDPFKNMLAAGVASVLGEIAIPTKPGSSFTTREQAVRSAVTGITTAAMDRHGNLAEKVLGATVGTCITTLGQNAGEQVSSVILNARNESTASQVMMRDMNTSIGASEERKVVQEAGELSVAQNARAHEAEGPVKRSINKTDDSVAYSQPELLKISPSASPAQRIEENTTALMPSQSGNTENYKESEPNMLAAVGRFSMKILGSIGRAVENFARENPEAVVLAGTFMQASSAIEEYAVAKVAKAVGKEKELAARKSNLGKIFENVRGELAVAYVQKCNEFRVSREDQMGGGTLGLFALSVTKGKRIVKLANKAQRSVNDNRAPSATRETIKVSSPNVKVISTNSTSDTTRTVGKSQRVPVKSQNPVKPQESLPVSQRPVSGGPQEQPSVRGAYKPEGQRPKYPNGYCGPINPRDSVPALQRPVVFSPNLRVSSTSGSTTLTLNPYAIHRGHSISGKNSSRQVEKLTQSMRDHGWQGNPVEVAFHQGKYYLLDGHHRIAAAKRLNLEVPIKIIEDIKNHNTTWESIEEIIRDSLCVNPDRLQVKFNIAGIVK